MDWLAIGLGTVGTTLSLVMLVPQGLIIWRARSFDGVSIPAWAVLILTLSIWLGFATRTGNITMSAGNVLALLVCFWVIIGILRAQDYRSDWLRRALLAIVPGVPAAVALGYVLRGPAIGVILVGTALTWLPQVFRSARTAIGAGASDVSRRGLLMGIAANSAWTLHGVILPDALIGTASFVQVVVIAMVLLFETVAARRRSRVPDRPVAALARGVEEGGGRG